MRTQAFVIAIAAAAISFGSVQPIDLKARLDAFIPRAMKELAVVPGLSIAVTSADTTIYTAGFGFADIPARTIVTPGTSFYAASMIKAFTGMTAAVLAIEGVLDLDAPLDRYFPGFKPPDGVD